MYPCVPDNYVKPVRRALLYPVTEPDRSMTRVRFLALADIYLGE